MEACGALLIVVGIIGALFVFLSWPIAVILVAGWLMLTWNNSRKNGDDDVV